MGVSKTNQTYASQYKKDLSVTQTSNVGIDATTRVICSGDGADSALSLSDDVLSVRPVNDDSVGTLLCKTSGGDNVLSVDTSSSLVKAGVSQVNVLTMVKEMGLYEFSPSIVGYHYPLIANMVGMAGDESLTFESDWGNGDDPAAFLNVSTLTDPENAVAIFWYLDYNITLDSVRFLARADGNATLNFHLESYDLDESSDHGDLTNGLTCASASVAATSSTMKTGTFSLDSEDINAGKVVVGFVENETDTVDFTVVFQINYHIR